MRDIASLVVAVKNGEQLSDISRRWKWNVYALRLMLKREGMDYREVMQQRKKEREEEQWKRCLKLARKHGRILTYEEFKAAAIPHSKIGIHLNRLKEMGFEQRLFNPSRLSDDELLKELFRIYKKIKIIPATKHIVKYSDYVKNTYINRFGSIRNAVRLMKKYYKIE